MSKKFIEIITTYPAICTYPEYEGKPYYSIQYEENGEIFVGFGTYKPEVLSEYIREYFIGADGAERKRGKWIITDTDDCYCSECKKDPISFVNGSEFWWLDKMPNFCPHCGADMREKKQDG